MRPIIIDLSKGWDVKEVNNLIEHLPITLEEKNNMKIEAEIYGIIGGKNL